MTDAEAERFGPHNPHPLSTKNTELACDGKPNASTNLTCHAFRAKTRLHADATIDHGEHTEVTEVDECWGVHTFGNYPIQSERSQSEPRP